MELRADSVKYCIVEGDANVDKVQETLRGKGVDVQVLQPGETAPAGAIAFFTDEAEVLDFGSMCSIRTACHRVHPVAPESIQTTPFVIAISPAFQNGVLAEKILGIAWQFELWLTAEGGGELPWGQKPGSPNEALDKWLLLAIEVRNTSNYKLTESLRL